MKERSHCCGEYNNAEIECFMKTDINTKISSFNRANTAQTITN